MNRGIDISKHQAGLNLGDVKRAGFNFVILRGGYTGYGADRTKQKDNSFENFYAQAKRVGLAVGAYWYSCAKSRSEGEQEAIYLHNNCLKGKQFEMPIYIDVEDSKWQANDKAGVTDAILGFCDYLESRGYFVGVYSSLSWFGTKFDVQKLDKITKWVARWQQNANSKPQVNFSAFDMWQYTDSAKVGGKTVDSDICYIDFESIIKRKALNGFFDTFEPTISHSEAQKTQNSSNPQDQNSKEQGLEVSPIVWNTYTVKRGDNLTKIAKRFKTTVAELVKKNKIADPNKIYVGQVLKI